MSGQRCGVSRMEYSSAENEEYSIEENEILPLIITWMVLKGVMINKSDKERKILYDFTCAWHLQKNQNK